LNITNFVIGLTAGAVVVGLAVAVWSFIDTRRRSRDSDSDALGAMGLAARQEQEKGGQ
jgi:hypothetical protein